MSTPQQQLHSHSRTPSKSSLRRTSGPQNSSQRNLQPQPSPRFKDSATTEVRYSPRSPPNQTLDYDSNEDDDDDDATEDALIKRDFDPQQTFEHHEGSYFPTATATAQELTQLFEPLFTLVEDNVTSEHHHPSIYYVFADDDHEVITEAALRSLEEDELGGSSASASAATQEKARDADSIEQGRPLLPPSQPGIREHYLILDLQPSDGAGVGAQPLQPELQSQVRSSSQGPADDILQHTGSQSQSNVRATPFVVSSFSSLSPDWQIQSATITSAPTMSEATSGQDENYMLRIEGRGFADLGSSEVLAAGGGRKAGTAGSEGGEPTGSTLGKERDHETLEDMIDRFQNNLNDIRKLIEVDVVGAASGMDHGADGVEVDTDDDQGVAQDHHSFDFEAQD